MKTFAFVLNALALSAALYDGKLLTWDIAADDLRKGNGGWAILIFALVVSTVFVLLPGFLGMRWAAAGRAGAALVVALVSLALSGVGFAILASAFVP